MTQNPLTEDTVNQIKHDIIFGVGYSQPQRHSRFKKGQSGNPKGRPRKDRSQSAASTSHTEGSNAAIMSRVLNEEVTVSRNGRRRKISKAEFVQRNTEKQAAGGSILANRDLRGQLHDEDKYARQEIEAHHAYWRDYLVRRENDIEATSAKGLPPSRFWIDPEDIFFEDGQFVKVRGPQTENDKPLYNWLGKFCDALLGQAYLESCSVSSGKPGAVPTSLEEVRMGSCEYYCQKILKTLPHRMMKEHEELDQELCVILFMRGIRGLRKAHRLLWNDIKLKPVPQGYFGNIDSSLWLKFCKGLHPLRGKYFELLLLRNSRPKRYGTRRNALTQ